MQAMRADNKSFLSNIQEQAQSTPLRHLNDNTPVSSNSTLKKKARKRKSNENDGAVIDLTPPKTEKVNGSTFSNSDSDVEIIETVPEVIDLANDDDGYTLDMRSSVSTATVTAGPTKQDETTTVDTVVTTDNAKVDCFENADNNIASDDLGENNSLPCSSKDLNLFIQDKTGGEHFEPPVYDMPTIYDMVSDDSFCFDSTPTPTPLPQISSKSFDLTLTPSLLSQISNDSLIVDVSDDLTLMPSPKRKHVTSSSNIDDSVVFVSETLVAPKPHVIPAPNYISLNRKPVRNTKRKQPPRNSPRKKRRFSPSTGTNSLAKNKEKPIEGTKRMVIIDGSNVAYSHGGSKIFSIEGIAICLDYFTKRGYEVRALVPQMRRKKFKSSNQELLEKLHNEKKITFTPCKILEEGGHVTSYDDRVILEFACQLDAAVVSNDNYRDIRKEKPEFSDLVGNRIIGYSFINDVLVIPPDPYGRKGPSLEEILIKRDK